MDGQSKVLDVDCFGKRSYSLRDKPSPVHRKKPLMENSFFLDLHELTRAGVLDAPGTTWRLPDTRRMQEFGLSDFSMRYDDTGRPSLWIQYNMAVKGIIQPFLAQIALVPQACHFGGHRLWLGCPGIKGKGPCSRRYCQKLYLVQGNGALACRHCHGLTYEACRYHHNPDYDLFHRPYRTIARYRRQMARARSRSRRASLMAKIRWEKAKVGAYIQWSLERGVRKRSRLTDVQIRSYELEVVGEL